MNKILLGFFISLQANFISAFAATSTISYPNGLWISVEAHCIEKGFARPVNPIHYQCTKPFGRENEQCRKEDLKKILLKIPLLTVERIDLGKNRIFTKASQFKTKNIKLSSGKLFTIPHCRDSVIDYENEVLIERKASPQEKVVYGALWRDGIKIIDGESYPIEEIGDRIEQFSERGGDKDEKGLSNLMLYYSTPNCEDGEVVERDWQDFFKSGGEGSGNGFVSNDKGGEGSGNASLREGGEGSGNGRYTWGNENIASESLVMNFNMQPQLYRSLSDRPNAVERWLGYRNRWYDILSGNQEVPTSVARTRCK
ncbi:MAG: hypothetical protein Fur0010_13320 [Bdellovibrio sp.]